MEEQEETTSSLHRSSVSSASSPEFSFWPSSSLSNLNPETNVSLADDLFSNGVLLPTFITDFELDDEIEENPTHEIIPDTEIEIETDPIPEPKLDSSSINPASLTAASTIPASSKRWKDIFKVGEKSQKEKSSKPPQLKHNKHGTIGSTDISINIWPFGRSRSAGTASSSRKPAGVSPVRKSSSAPCSRSNSRGESGKPGSGRRWAASPGRPGVHVGRTSPVWQIKRQLNNGVTKSPVEPVKEINRPGSARVINLSVNSCIGYGRKELRCGGEKKDRVAGDDRNNVGLFGIKGFFSKKVH